MNNNNFIYDGSDRLYDGQKEYLSYIKSMNQLNDIDHFHDNKSVVLVENTTCREALISSLKNLILKNENKDKTAFILSGGVDTSAILEAASSNTISFDIGVTVLVSTVASDRFYAIENAKKHNLKHDIVDISLEKMLDFLPFCVKSLKTFDGMELRNSMVIAVALHKIKDLGYHHCITGDGSDELLGGYSFTWNSEMPIWKEKRDALLQSMTYSTPVMAKALGLSVDSPFLTKDFICWANSIDKKDCIGERDIELSLHGPREQHLTGKICLRDAFPEAVSAWRRKDPIEIGSGSSEFRTTDFFKNLLMKTNINNKDNLENDDLQYTFSDKVNRIWIEDRVRIRDEEHLWYYTEFKNTFPNGLVGKERFGQDPCIGCGYELATLSTLFCNTCGAYPARE